MVPAVMFLEMVLDKFRSLTPEQAADIAAEVKEFRMLGAQRHSQLAQRLLATQKKGEKVYTEAEMAYVMGVEVARVLLQTMPAAVAAKIEL